MKLFVPTIGTVLILSQDWRFRLWPEHRNETMFQALGFEHYWPDHDRIQTGWTVIKGWQNQSARNSGRRDDDIQIPVMHVKVKQPVPNNSQTVATDCQVVTYLTEKRLNTSGSEEVQLEEYYLMMTLPAGTELRVDRIYIRKGSEDFDSMTFIVNACPIPELTSKGFGGKQKRPVRFWAKLTDINGIEFEEKV